MSLFVSMQAGIDRTNSVATSQAQRIQKWMILPRDFSLEGGELGPTMKVGLVDYTPQGLQPGGWGAGPYHEGRTS